MGYCTGVGLGCLFVLCIVLIFFSCVGFYFLFFVGVFFGWGVGLYNKGCLVTTLRPTAKHLQVN